MKDFLVLGLIFLSACGTSPSSWLRTNQSCQEQAARILANYVEGKSDFDFSNLPVDAQAQILKYLHPQGVMQFLSVSQKTQEAAFKALASQAENSIPPSVYLKMREESENLSRDKFQLKITATHLMYLKMIHDPDFKINPNHVWSEAHDDQINSLMFHGEDRLISVSDDQAIKVWDLEHGRLITTLKDQFQREQSIVPLSDGNIATLSLKEENSTVKIWNSESGELIKTLNDPNQQEPILSFVQVDDHKIVSGHADGSLSLWDLSLNRWEQSLENHFMYEKHSSLKQRLLKLPDGPLLFPSHDLTIRGIDPKNYKLTLSLDSDSPLFMMYDLIPLSHRQLAITHITGKIVIWDLSTIKINHTLTANPLAKLLQLTDGRLAFYEKVAQNGDESEFILTIWDPKTDHRLRLGVQMPLATFHLVETQDHKLLAVSESLQHPSILWDLQKGKQVKVVKDDAQLSSVLLSKNRWVLAEDNEGKSKITVYDLWQSAQNFVKL